MSRFLILSLLLALLPVLGEGPLLLEPSDKAADIAIPVTLRWQGDAGARFECAVARDVEFTDAVPVEPTVTGAALTLSHLLPDVTYHWRVRAPGGEWSAARAFTTSEAVPVAARDGRLVTALAMGNDLQIFVMNADGSEPTRLTALNSPTQPALSFDGRQIAFTVGGDGLPGLGGLWLMQADGSGCHKLPVPYGRLWLPFFSPSGDVIYFGQAEKEKANGLLCAINTDGTGFTRLPIPASMQDESAISEDGTTLVAIIRSKISLYDAATAEKRMAFENVSPFQLQSPCFSRDGSYVLTSAYAEGKMKLMQIFTDDSGVACLATEDRVFSPCVSPDGSVILFRNGKGLNQVLPDGKSIPLAMEPPGSYRHLRWQAAPGRWAPDPPAMTVPADKATAVPIPTNLSWTPMPGVTGYALQVATGPEFKDPEVAYAQVYGPKIQLETLRPETTYFWRVRSVFRNEQGPWSAPRAFTTNKAGPQGFGRVNGIVTFEGGGPLAKMRVTVTIGTKATVFTTDEEGAFAGSVPVGAGAARVEGAEEAVTIKAGEVTNVALVQKPDAGVVVTATLPDGKPFEGYISGASRYPVPDEGRDPVRYNQMRITPRTVGPGVFWFPTVRAEDTEFAVDVLLQGTNLIGHLAHRWSLTDRQAVHRVTTTVPVPVYISLMLRDEQGNPLRNTRVEGRIARRVNAFNYWADPHRNNPLSESDITVGQPERFTDGEGRLELGDLVVNTYWLTLQTDGREGQRVELVVGEDGAYTPQSIRLQSLRTVTQAVFRPDGVPAANAGVYASFTRGGEVVVLHGTTNERGEVTWTGLPHRRVIVSGETVAAGVIPAEGTTFTQPLPAPEPERAVKLQAELRVDGIMPVTVGFVLQTPEGFQMGRNYANLNPTVTGVPFTCFWGANLATVQAHLLAGAYLPYVDNGVELLYFPIADLPLTDYAGVSVKGRLLTKSGNPVPSKTLQIMPAAGNSLYDIMTAGKVDWLLETQATAGVFTASLPPTGPYTISIGGRILATVTITPEKAPEEIVVTYQ